MSGVIASSYSCSCRAAVDEGGADQSEAAHNELYWQLLRHISPLAAGT